MTTGAPFYAQGWFIVLMAILGALTLIIVLAVVGFFIWRYVRQRLAKERAREKAEERERERISELRRLQREHDEWLLEASRIK